MHDVDNENFKTILASVLCFQLGLAPVFTAVANAEATSCGVRVKSIQEKIAQTAQILLKQEEQKVLQAYSAEPNITAEVKTSYQEKLGKIKQLLSLTDDQHAVLTIAPIVFLLFVVLNTKKEAKMGTRHLSNFFTNPYYHSRSAAELEKAIQSQFNEVLKDLNFISKLKKDEIKLKKKIKKAQSSIVKRKELIKIKGKTVFQNDMLAIEVEIFNNFQVALKGNSKALKASEEILSLNTKYSLTSFVAHSRESIKNYDDFLAKLTDYISKQAYVESLSKIPNAERDASWSEVMTKAKQNLQSLKLDLKNLVEESSKIAQTLKYNRHQTALARVVLVASAASIYYFVINRLNENHHQYDQQESENGELSYSEKLQLKQQDRAEKMNFLALLMNPETQTAVCSAYDQNEQSMNAYQKSAITALGTQMLLSIRK